MSTAAQELTPPRCYEDLSFRAEIGQGYVPFGTQGLYVWADYHTWPFETPAGMPSAAGRKFRTVTYRLAGCDLVRYYENGLVLVLDGSMPYLSELLPVPGCSVFDKQYESRTRRLIFPGYNSDGSAIWIEFSGYPFSFWGHYDLCHTWYVKERFAWH